MNDIDVASLIFICSDFNYYRFSLYKEWELSQIESLGWIIASPFNEIEKIKKDSGELLHIFYKNGLMESYSIKHRDEDDAREYEQKEKIKLLYTAHGGVDYFKDGNIEIFITNNKGEDNSTG